MDGASVMLISPKGHKIHCALHFEFQALTNEAKYEAHIAGLWLASMISQSKSLQLFPASSE